MNEKNNSKKTILGHIAFWVFYLISNTFSQGYYSGEYTQQLLYFMHYMPVVMALTYFTTNYLIPKYLFARKYLLFFGFVVLSAIVTSFLQRLNIIYIVIPIYSPNADFEFPLFSGDIIARITLFYPYVILASAIAISYKWYLTEKNEQNLKEEKLSNELKFLKAQINPHFLFNTMNSLYVLAKKKDDNTPEAIVKLADLFRYIVYECNDEFTDLAKELKIVKDYIELEKLRHGEYLEHHYDVRGSIDKIKIPSLLLLPLVENAFKHGISKSVHKKEFVFECMVEDDKVCFKVVNSKDEDKDIANIENGEGVGLANLKRRLDLTYENNYYFEHSDQGNKYMVQLTIYIRNSDEI